MKNSLKITILFFLLPAVSFASDAEYDRRCHCDDDVRISYTPPFFDSKNQRQELFQDVNDHINNHRRKYIYCKVKNVSENEKENYKLIGDFDSKLDIKFIGNTKSYTNTCE